MLELCDTQGRVRSFGLEKVGTGARRLTMGVTIPSSRVDGDASDLTTKLSVTTADGRQLWGLGSGGPVRPSMGHLRVTSGRNDAGPASLIIRAGPQVSALVVLLSDGTREDLVLHGDVERLGCRIAALVYPRHLDVHRIDAIGADGTTLSDR